MIPVRSLISTAVILSTATAVRGDDWPQWLGPNRNAVWAETGIIETFDNPTPKPRWEVSIGGGYAGPAVANGRVFVMDYRTNGDTTPSPSRRNELQGVERVLCLSSKNGEKLWEHEYDCAYAISYPAGPRATPTVDDGLVYALGAEGHLWCLSVADGRVVWSRHFAKDYAAKTPMWGYCGHPLIDGDRLICVVGGKNSVAVAFDKRTGKELWRSLSSREPGYCPPTIIQHGGRRQLLIWHTQSINSLDPETGQTYWSVPLVPDYGMAIATPQLSRDLLFVGGIVNKSVLLRLGTQKRQPIANVVWKGENGRGLSPVNASPIIDNGFLYGTDRQGELRCVRLETGEHVWSTFAATTGKRIANSATAFLVKNGRRYFLFNENGELIIARLTPKKYDEVSRARILEPTTPAFGRKVVWSHPAFAERSVFARNDKKLVRVSLAAGAVR